MERRLYYFYQLTKKKITVLYISGFIYYLGQSIYGFLDLFQKQDDYFSLKLGFNLDITFRVFFLILYIPSAISVFLYIYLITIHIDFVLYVRAWMIGYQIYHKFENMSYLILCSCFYKNIEDDSDDSERSLIRYSSDHTFTSIIKDTAEAANRNTRIYSLSSEHQTILEDSSS